MALVLSFRRKREGRTDYRARLSLLKSGKARIVFRKGSKNLSTQVVRFSPEGDKPIYGMNSRSLIKLGWNYSRNSIPAAYLFGLFFGKKLKKAKDYTQLSGEGFILDLGMKQFRKGSVESAFLKGLVDAELSIAHGEGVYPSEDRLSGKHIAGYAKKLEKESPEEYKKQFSEYIAKKLSPSEITKDFEKARDSILKGDI
ncbi:MAG TPA: 50S ribosomal protein L18 [Candidatus Woesearchaeota archaeon]|nr:50S ribosomal protein L18 [Candidatus Woesearchaeota archaeon]